MKKLAAFVVFAFLAQYVWQDLRAGDRFEFSESGFGSSAATSAAFEQRRSNVQVRGEGKVKGTRSPTTTMET
jgi:hypothetical protein